MAEGPDCSGLTFKAWKLRPSQGAYGGRWYGKLMNIHGPYVSGEYHAPKSGWPFSNVAKCNLLTMDALAKNGHIAMLYTVQTSKNTDIVIEAVGWRLGTHRSASSSVTTGANRRTGVSAEMHGPRTVGPGAPERRGSPIVVVP